MAEIKQTRRASILLNQAVRCGVEHRHEFVMPEHLLKAMLWDGCVRSALLIFGEPLDLEKRLDEMLSKVETVPEDIRLTPEFSQQLLSVGRRAAEMVETSSAQAIDIPQLTSALMEEDESWAAFLLKDFLHGQEGEFMSRLIEFCEGGQSKKAAQEKSDEKAWRQWTTCMNDLYEQQNPLVGRNEELNRTIQVLCRRDKNNPLYVGEPGVGKTALVWGLAQRIAQGHVPGRLQGSRIYQIDLGGLLAGTQYRGEFEKRIKQIMDGIAAEGSNHIVYIDEIHNLVGAGATGSGAMDASNMLKPYLEAGNIRFLGSTTYEEFNRYFSRSKGLVRRFQQIDVVEPSVDEAKHILQQLKPRYEKFHGVTYTDEAIAFAVEASAKHINDRSLPDKALDLIDEAGAAMEMSPEATPIGKKDIADVLAKTCKVDALAEAADDDFQQLKNLSHRMKAQIYGQDEAIVSVVEAVQMSRAGLIDDHKPLASLLFVGPTGVGKTEVARVLARELGIELVRFDMSEYTEKHAVAKLIGSPAGYVGYEDGGLLTDAIRKSPNCVLLLDEIEKAHQDIYNILLQVMDYARLTDNKGRHADFRNVVLIMTSNAGAQYASQSGIGFSSTVTRGDAMMGQVKKTFKPEFLNRLSAAVVFHDMDQQMATLILKKKLGELEQRLTAKQVTMTLDNEAFHYLLTEGYSSEYGAREMDRVLSQRLKPLLMREILFGSLRNGGAVTIKMKDGSLAIG